MESNYNLLRTRILTAAAAIFLAISLTDRIDQ